MDTSYVMGLDLGPPNEHTALAAAEQLCPGRDAHYHVLPFAALRVRRLRPGPGRFRDDPGRELVQVFPLPWLLVAIPRT